jgi:hypothetical protein
METAVAAQSLTRNAGNCATRPEMDASSCDTAGFAQSDAKAIHPESKHP